MKIITFILVVFFIFSSSCKSLRKTPNRIQTKGEQVLQLQPGPEDGMDAFVEDYPFDNYRNTNFGKLPAFLAASWTAGGTPLIVRSLIRFDLSEIPVRSTIISAKLSLFAFDDVHGHGRGHSTLGGDNSCIIKQITAPWDEQTVTWNTQPETTSEYQVTISASNGEMQDFTDIEITGLIQNIVNKGYNYGLMLKLTNETMYTKMTFASSDAADENKRPRLTIKYYLN